MELQLIFFIHLEDLNILADFYLYDLFILFWK